MTVLCTTGLAEDINMPSKSHNLIVQELAARLGLHQKECFFMLTRAEESGHFV